MQGAPLGLEMVPLITTGYILENDINALIRRATVKSLICPDVWAEGIVVRPMDELTDETEDGESLINRRVSFKVINPEFLIKFDE